MQEDKEELININVIIADRPYPLKIKPEEEENVRKAAKTVNEKVKQFQQMYAGKDKQDFLAMCALMYAVDVITNEDKLVVEDNSIADKLDDLELLLSNSLKN